MDDEFISLMFRGIKLAKEIEHSLQNLGQLEMMSKLDEMIKVFVTGRERLSNAIENPSFYPHQMLYQQQHQPLIDLNLQEYLLRSNFFPTQFISAERKSSPTSSGGIDIAAGSSGDVQVMASSSSTQRRRKSRKDDAEKRTTRVAAPRMGNTEIPPEDGYTWRKYGQKEILGSKFPRGYYRCTHQKLYQCPAKKQVQKLDDDPYTFEVTYRGDHTCHMSSTAPSIPPPPETTQAMATRSWLEFSLGGSSSGVASENANPSITRYGKEAEFPVADMADVMFNSGSSSSNSMELIFTSIEDHPKWDPSTSRDHKKDKSIF